MIGFVSILLFAIPPCLAYLGGIRSSGLKPSSSFLLSVSLSLYPLAHRYVLRLLRDSFLDLNLPTQMFAANVTGLLMLIEVPLCFLTFFVARAIALRKSTNPSVRFPPIADIGVGRQSSIMKEQRGYTPEELDRGEDQAWHIPAWGCLAVLAFVAVVVWLVLR